MSGYANARAAVIGLLPELKGWKVYLDGVATGAKPPWIVVSMSEDGRQVSEGGTHHEPSRQARHPRRIPLGTGHRHRMRQAHGRARRCSGRGRVRTHTGRGFRSVRVRTGRHGHLHPVSHAGADMADRMARLNDSSRQHKLATAQCRGFPIKEQQWQITYPHILRRASSPFS